MSNKEMRLELAEKIVEAKNWDGEKSAKKLAQMYDLEWLEDALMMSELEDSELDY